MTERMRALTWMMAVAVLGTVGAGQARASGGLFWQFHDTGLASHSPHTAIGLNNGMAWPVVFEADGEVYRLLATPNPLTGTNWRQVASHAPMMSPIVAKSSPDGRVAAFSPDGMGGVVVANTDGSFSQLGYQAAAFAPDGSLRLASGDQIVGLGEYGGGGDILDMAVAPDGTIGVINDMGEYWEYRFGAWSEQGKYLSDFGPPVDYVSARLAFDELAQPHIAYLDTNAQPQVFTADFDIVSGLWSVTTHGEARGVLAIAGTDLGGGALGIAYVDSNNLELTYEYFDTATGLWTADTVVASGLLDQFQSVGLAFDHAGLPVISYVQGSGYWLAYDPIVVPEPASVVLLGVLAAGLTRRRRAA